MSAIASIRELPDRRPYLFGRNLDLSFLVGRARRQVLTAVVGRPQIGKTWLLDELARFLTTDYEPRYHVGITESSGTAQDLLLRAVIDLYGRWLRNSNYLEQARIVWEQQKGNLITGFGIAIGAIFEKLWKSGDPVSGLLGSSVQKAIEGLVSTNQDLLSGGAKTPRLQYDQAWDLISMAARISGRPLAIVVDQWEQSPSVEAEASILSAFLRNIEEWPQCHVFLGFSKEERAYNLLADLARAFSGTAAIYELGPMNLKNKASQSSLISFLNAKVIATRAVRAEDLLRRIHGYPGTIYQWTREYWAEKMISREDLEARARDAQQYRFKELDTLLPGLHLRNGNLQVDLRFCRPGQLKIGLWNGTNTGWHKRKPPRRP